MPHARVGSPKAIQSASIVHVRMILVLSLLQLIGTSMGANPARHHTREKYREVQEKATLRNNRVIIHTKKQLT